MDFVEIFPPPGDSMEAPERTPLGDLVPFAEDFWELPAVSLRETLLRQSVRFFVSPKGSRKGRGEGPDQHSLTSVSWGGAGVLPN